MQLEEKFGNGTKVSDKDYNYFNYSDYGIPNVL